METPTIFPYFEKGLPLRSRDLNAVFRRAEEEVRHTRTCLQGMGILYGLHVLPTANGITVNAGAGVTSEGYLYCSHTDVLLTNIASTDHKIVRRQFTVESFGDFLDAPASKDEENNAVAYLELAQTGAPITPDNLKNKWLIVFFEIVSEKLQGCATCDKGTKAEVKTKFLLIDDLVWTGLSQTFICSNQGIGQSADVEPALLSLPRLGLNDGCIRFAEDGDLVKGYTATLGASQIKPITDALKATFQALDSVFGLAGDAALTLFKLPALTVANAQYVHDYLRLLIRAYNEFVSTPFARHMVALPPETCFPKHLVLGHFDATGTFSETDRTPLYRPPFDDATDSDFEYARKLYDRLISLLINHDFGSLEAKKELRITPSRRATFPIGMQAIPFYLKSDEVRKTWRPATKFNELILSYDNTKRLQFQPYFDESDFYRIEGHVNQPLIVSDSGKNQLEDLRDCLNLPFNVVVVALSRNAKNFPSLSDFARQYSGLEHQGGVPSGGTFVVVISGDGGNEVEGQGNRLIIGDFCLPYWVQLPVPVPIADFEIDDRKTIQGQGEQFTFVNTSKNYDRLEWRVDGGDSLSDKEQFTFTFPITDLLVTHYFVTLTAINGDRESVEKTTIVTVHIKEQIPQPLAVFAVEDIDNVETSDDGNTITVVALMEEGQPFTIQMAFENLSENADKYLWQIDGKKLAKPKTKDKLLQTFTWKNEEVGNKSFIVQLTASRDGQPDSVAKKEVVAAFPVIL